ncbi:MAG: branched-chain amino acid ABC transporter permease [Deltaproteobacteria bacterium]|nr:branched-chain amino acid ABC transporter permease [Deltaproteobacteria bacterium]
MTTIVIQTLINGLILGSFYVLLAAGLSLIFSIMGIVNFAHGALLMLGAFCSYVFITKLGLNFFFSLLISVGVMVILGFIIQKIIFNPLKGNELNMMVISLGLAIVLENSAVIIWGPDDRVLPFFELGVLKISNVFLPIDRLLILLSAIVLIVGLYILIQKTKIGLAVRAVAQDLDAATLQGINSNTIFPFSFGIGCGLAAAAGTLVSPLFLVSPYMGTLPMVKAFVVIVLGGLGSIIGAVIGGIILGLMESLVATFFGAVFQNAISFLILIVVLVLKPEGLFGEK